VGDRDYGHRPRPPRGGEKAFRILEQLTRPALHAAQLGFRHPRSDEVVRFEAPLAPDIQKVVDALRLLREQT
jgi:23S rRNA pseudouridine1911/1915/1917 synthase